MQPAGANKVAGFSWDLFCSAVPAKRTSLPQHPVKAAAQASESSSSEESSDEEEEEDKKKKPVQVCDLKKHWGLERKKPKILSFSL